MTPDSADYRIKLPVFEGPLDLLLFLIRKNEIDIYDIPIESVTRQYIEVLHSMKQLDLDIAGEFFVMAASLMEIKSRMLLPRGQAAAGPEDEDDALDPRWELVHQLLQYKKFKEAAGKLDALSVFQRDMLPRQVAIEAVSEAERDLKPADKIELWNVFNIILRRLAEKLVIGQIEDEQVTVADKMEELLELTRTRTSFVFTELFTERVTVRVLVATFIAVLELTRLHKLRIRQDEAYTDIICTAVGEDDNPATPPPPPPPPEEPQELVLASPGAPLAAVVAQISPGPPSPIMPPEEPPMPSESEKPLETPAEPSTVAS